MKKTSILLIVSLWLLLLGGCWDKKEIEDNTFAVLLGIDAAADQGVMITVAFPLTQTQGGSAHEGMDNGSGKYSVMSVKARNVVEGLDMFSTKLAGPLALYTVKTIVISQEIAQSDMLRQIFSSWTYKEIRNTANVLVSECKAAEFIEARTKDSLIDPLRQEELLLEQASVSANYKPIGLLELLTNLKSSGGNGVAMYGGIAAQSEDEGPGAGGTTKDGYFPGEVPISADNDTQISGLAVFHDAKMVGALNSQEVQTYAMLIQDNTKKVLTVQDPLDPDYEIVISILPNGKRKINSAIADGVAVFTIDLGLKCVVESVQSQVDYTVTENYTILAEHIRQICVENMTGLIEKTQKDYNADILHLGNKLAHHFRTVSEWEQYDWPAKYQDAQISLRVSVDVERTEILIP